MSLMAGPPSLRNDKAWRRHLAVWRENGRRPGRLKRLQRERLGRLLALARAHSPFYRAHLANLPPEPTLADLPPMTRARLMADFDSWATDPEISLARVQAYLANPAAPGERFLGRYEVWTSSGTTGMPGIFLQDDGALAVYDSLTLRRGWARWLGWRGGGALLCRGFRVAGVLATGGRFAGLGYFAHWNRRAAKRTRLFSVLTPHDVLVDELNQFQPTILVSYPGALDLLARSQRQGRLRLRPVCLLAGGEWLDPAVQSRVTSTFACPLFNLYGASEFIAMAFSCPEGWLHVNADWVLLEPVDAAYQPVSPAEPAHTVLLTNLANRVQPLLRYDLGDAVTWLAAPCPCGNPWPAIQVAGRRDDLISLTNPDGRAILLLPMALAAIIETTPGIGPYQLLQLGPRRLGLRLAAPPDGDLKSLWAALQERLRSYLQDQGASGFRLERLAEPPQPDPASGKLRQFIARPAGADDEARAGLDR